MYAQLEKTKQNESSAVANAVTQRKEMGGKLEFVDNRPKSVMQRNQQVIATHSQPFYKTGKIQRCINRKLATTKTMQLFAVPTGLTDLTNMVNKVSNDIQNHTFLNGRGRDDTLYGSEQWGNDTYWAANRKLDEWNLVKELVNADIRINDAENTGFGINDTKEPDGFAFDKNKNNYIAVGENKIVSGKFDKIAENINSSLSQLTTGTRSVNYNGTPLLARVNIGLDSNAYEHLISLDDGQIQRQKDNWKNILWTYYNKGIKHWRSDCSLTLLISVDDGQELFKETITQAQK